MSEIDVLERQEEIQTLYNKIMKRCREVGWMRTKELTEREKELLHPLIREGLLMGHGWDRWENAPLRVKPTFDPAVEKNVIRCRDCGVDITDSVYVYYNKRKSFFVCKSCLKKRLKRDRMIQVDLNKFLEA